MIRENTIPSAEMNVKLHEFFLSKEKKKRQKSKYEVTSQTHHHWARDVSTRSLGGRNIAIVFDSRAV